jgi:exopolysaccharide production protein ExoY
MATRIEESAPTASQPFQAVPHDAVGDALLSPNARLFGLISEEPLIEAASTIATAPSIALVSSDAPALFLYRCMDLMIASLCLLVLWPVMLAATVLVLLSSEGPILYSHPRFGRHGEIFGCLKFRTMEINADRLLAELLKSSSAVNELWTRDRKLPDDPRITYFGRFLRRYSVDELPQLFNVLRGEMSIVGPRPLATDEAHFYADAFTAYCSVKPGITGPWQISGRNQISFTARAWLDCEYARTKSVRQDFQIILRTIPVVMRGTGF